MSLQNIINTIKTKKIIENQQLLIYGNILSLILTIIMNGLANALPINGKTTAELSDSYPNLFVPAGYVFSIWGVIYLLLIVFAVFQYLPDYRNKGYLEEISIFFIISNLANSLWIVLWHYELVLLSLFAMLIILGSLVLIYVRLDVGKDEVPLKERFVFHVPFSVYLGWITVATVANVTALLVSINWDGLGILPEVWTVIVLVVANVIASIIVVTRGDYAYGLVPVWAFVGIFVKQLSNNQLVSLVALLLAIIIFVEIIGTYSYKKFWVPKKG